MILKPEEHKELLGIDPEYKELCVLEAYDSFWRFCLYMDYDFFYLRREVLEHIADKMQCLVAPPTPEEELDILNVSVPPRTGKSYLCTLFCDWTLGRDKGGSIMRNTVTSRLYKKFSKDLIGIVKGETHRGRSGDVFTLDLKTQNVEEGWELQDSRQGVSYFGGGVGGSIIGFGADLLSIIDDSIKNEEEAMSELQLDKKWSWYTSAVDSRKEKGCKDLFIGTRWSRRDIVGMMEENGRFKGSRALDITIPALDENNKSYCEEIHTTEKLLEKKRITSEVIWEAEWQQAPVEAKGLLYSSSELNYFDMEDLNQDPDGVIIVGDIADEGDDSLSVPVGYQYGDKIYIVDVLFTTDRVEITEPLTAAMIDKYKPDVIQFESNNGGKGFARAVDKITEHKKRVNWKVTTKNKHTRIMLKSGVVKENFYFRNDSGVSKMYADFMRELCSYSIGGKNRHDDAPDAITMMAEATGREKWGW